MKKIETWEEFQEICLVLYHRKINDRIIVQIAQLIDKDLESCMYARKRSQFLTLVIYDKDLNKWMCLKLSTVRKIWKFIKKKGFDKARRLKFFERSKLIVKEELSK